MTPKEKAQELLNKFIQTNGNAFFAKECALIAVDEILNMLVGIYDYDREVLYPYWQQVKEEIEKL
jgi:hypothetical protein